jgi:hypothetical protein
MSGAWTCGRRAALNGVALGAMSSKRRRRRRRRAWAVGGAFALAAAGVAWYVVDPGIASYQASGLLVGPALVIALVWLHRRLPIALQWTVALALLVAGPVGYLVVGGDQWWSWGQLMPLPFFLLVVAHAVRAGGLRGGGDGYPPPVSDGPLGPP